MAFIWYLIQAFLPKVFDYRLWQLLLLGPVVTIAQSGFNLAQTVQRARRDSVRYSLHASGNSLFKFVLAVGFIFLFDMKAEAMLIAIIIAGLPILIFEMLRLRKGYNFSYRNFSQPILRQLSHYGLPMVGIACANMILSSSDRYVIEYFCGSSLVGIYSAGYKIAENSATLFIYFLMTVSFPALIDSFEKAGAGETIRLMRYLLSIYLIILIPVVLGLSFLRREISSVLFDKSFYEAYIVIPWVLSGVFFMGMSMYFNKNFELMERTRTLLILIGSAAGLNIILNIATVPVWGILGAAISTNIAYFFGLAISIIFGRKLIRWDFPWNILFKTLIAGTGMCAAISLVPGMSSIPFGLMIKIFVGFVSYLTIISILERQTVMHGINLLKRRINPIFHSR